MKANIHPKMNDVTLTCICGATFQTKSTANDIQVEICNKCHPFNTGTQGSGSKAGAVEKFNRKFGFNKEKKTA